MIFAIEFERHMPSAVVFYIVISKFGHRYRFCPIVIFVTDKKPNISIYGTILSLGLAIGLKMKSYRKFLLDF